jgi:hypothetical protein
VYHPNKYEAVTLPAASDKWNEARSWWFLIERLCNPDPLASSWAVRAAVRIHDIGARAGADDADGLCRARYRRDMKKQRAIAKVERHVGEATVACPKCQKLISPPERLVEHFSGCSSGRRSSILDRISNGRLSDPHRLQECPDLPSREF